MRGCGTSVIPSERRESRDLHVRVVTSEAEELYVLPSAEMGTGMAGT